MYSLIPPDRVAEAVLFGPDTPSPHIKKFGDRPWFSSTLEPLDNTYDFYTLIDDNLYVQGACSRCSTSLSDFCVQLHPHLIPFEGDLAPLLLGECSRCERVYFVANPLVEALSDE